MNRLHILRGGQLLRSGVLDIDTHRCRRSDFGRPEHDLNVEEARTGAGRLRLGKPESINRLIHISLIVVRSRQDLLRRQLRPGRDLRVRRVGHGDRVIRPLCNQGLHLLIGSFRLFLRFCLLLSLLLVCRLRLFGYGFGDRFSSRLRGLLLLLLDRGVDLRDLDRKRTEGQSSGINEFACDIEIAVSSGKKSDRGLGRRSDLRLGTDHRHGAVRKQAHDFKTVSGGLGSILINDLNGKCAGRSDQAVCVLDGNGKEPRPRKLRGRSVHDVLFNIGNLFRCEVQGCFCSGEIGEVFIFAAVLIEPVICERLADFADIDSRALDHLRGGRDGQGQLDAVVFKCKFFIFEIFRLLRGH